VFEAPLLLCVTGLTHRHCCQGAVVAEVEVPDLRVRA
jgi:hypothetical protein